MRAKQVSVVLASGIGASLIACTALASPKSLVTLCPVEKPVVRASPTCSAAYLLSPRGYLVLPGTHVVLGVSTQRVNLMIRLAIF